MGPKAWGSFGVESGERIIELGSLKPTFNAKLHKDSGECPPTHLSAHFMFFLAGCGEAPRAFSYRFRLRIGSGKFL